MSQTPRYALSWSEHLNAISNGLSSLQQNEEFVDMTLAADGHFVKVHKIIMALVSPYLKEIIASMKCDHPVIFLNKVSYKTLNAILEYVYTGEVKVQFDNINEFILAAKNLHIRGLQDMNLVDDPQSFNEQYTNTPHHKIEPDCIVTLNNTEERCLNENMELTVQEFYTCMNNCETKVDTESDDSNHENVSPCTPTLHYTVSNRGNLQMILNKFIYYLKHTNKDNSRQWRCVDYLNDRKCPALIFTKDDIVLQRIAAHNHPLHEDKIFRKFRSGVVFAAIKDAMDKSGNVPKRTKEDPLNSE